MLTIRETLGNHCQYIREIFGLGTEKHADKDGV